LGPIIGRRIKSQHLCSGQYYRQFTSSIPLGADWQSRHQDAAHWITQEIPTRRTGANKEDPMGIDFGPTLFNDCHGRTGAMPVDPEDSCFFLRDPAEEGACSDRQDEDTLVGEVGACTRETVTLPPPKVNSITSLCSSEIREKTVAQLRWVLKGEERRKSGERRGTYRSDLRYPSLGESASQVRSCKFFMKRMKSRFSCIPHGSLESGSGQGARRCGRPYVTEGEGRGLTRGFGPRDGGWAANNLLVPFDVSNK
jgi:hypothetical protein